MGEEVGGEGGGEKIYRQEPKDAEPYRALQGRHLSTLQDSHVHIVQCHAQVLMSVYRQLHACQSPILQLRDLSFTLFLQGEFFGIYFLFFMYCIQHCFICRPSDSSVSEDAVTVWEDAATVPEDTVTVSEDAETVSEDADTVSEDAAIVSDDTWWQ